MNIRMNGTGIVGIITGIAGIAYAVYRENKMIETTKKIDMTIDAVSASSNVDIQQAVVDKAIEKAVDREVRRAIDDTARRVREDIQAEIHKSVKKEVEAQYKSIGEEVSDKISSIVSDIDEVAFKEKIAKRAEEKVMKKVDSVVNGAASTFMNTVGEKLKFAKDFSNMMADISGYNGRNNNGGGNGFRISLD